MASTEKFSPDIGHDRSTLARMIDTGQATEALAALDANPLDDWQQHYLRGSALAALRRAPEAFEELKRALAYAPGNPAPYAVLAKLCMTEREFELALRNAQQANSLAPENEEINATIAFALLELGRQEEALSTADLLVSKWPHSRRAHSVKGTILKAAGRIEEATESLRHALTIDPQSAVSAYELFMLTPPCAGDQVVARMRDIHRSGLSLDQRSQIYLEYTLGVAEEALGNHDEAFVHFLSGSSMARNYVSYDEPGVAALFERIKSTFKPELLRPMVPPPSSSLVPIFILGMPGSGSTLVEQIVASHRDVSGGGETTEFLRAVRRVEIEVGGRFPEFVPVLPGRWLERIANLYLNRLAARFPGARRITDGTPSNYLTLGFIRLLFPNAAIIHCRRDPLDNCVSMFTHLFAEDQPYTYELAELGRYYKLYESLMNHWRNVLPDGAFLDVDYEDLVANPETVIRAIIDYCGLDWDPNSLEYLNSKYPLRDAAGRAAHYSKFLSPLRESLGI